jgi:membrane protein YdbS with pleckstrin-like domain
MSQRLDDRKVFKPQYSAATHFARVGLPFGFFGLLIWAAAQPSALSSSFWLATLLLGTCTALLPFYVIRDVLFLNQLVVRRHFLPESALAVQEIERIERGTIVAGGRRIPLGRLENVDDLKQMAERWTAALALKAAARQPTQGAPRLPTRGYGGYASFWGLVLGVPVMIIQPPWLSVDPRWLLGATFLFVYIVFVYVLPRRL